MSTDPKYRPEPADRWIGGRTEPGRIAIRTEFLYGEHDPRAKVPEGQRLHAFYQGGNVVASDWPSRYDSQQGLNSHVHRAIASFGDDADVEIIVRRAVPAVQGEADERGLLEPVGPCWGTHRAVPEVPDEDVDPIGTPT